jgi:hypothetical protein
MKAKEFHALLLDAKTFKGDSKGDALGAIAMIFSAAPSKTVADVVKQLGEVKAPNASIFGSKLSSAQPQILALHKLMFGRAKDAVLKDISSLLALIERHGSASMDGFVEAAIAKLTAKPQSTKGKKKVLRTDLVDQYNRRLENALGDDPGFRLVYQDLLSNPDIGAQEASALAKRFASASPKSKDAAFKKILARHEALMTSRARSLANAGRIAG